MEPRASESTAIWYTRRDGWKKYPFYSTAYKIILNKLTALEFKFEESVQIYLNVIFVTYICPML